MKKRKGKEGDTREEEKEREMLRNVVKGIYGCMEDVSLVVKSRKGEVRGLRRVEEILKIMESVVKEDGALRERVGRAEKGVRRCVVGEEEDGGGENSDDLFTSSSSSSNKENLNHSTDLYPSSGLIRTAAYIHPSPVRRQTSRPVTNAQNALDEFLGKDSAAPHKSFNQTTPNPASSSSSPNSLNHSRKTSNQRNPSSPPTSPTPPPKNLPAAPSRHLHELNER